MNLPEPTVSAPDPALLAGDEPGIMRLLVVFLVATLIVGGVCLATGGQSLALVAILASAACLAGALGGHFAGIYPRGHEFITARLMASTAVRMVIPVALLIVSRSVLPELFARGMVYFVFLFYLVGLTTWVATRSGHLRTTNSGPAAPRDDRK